MTEKTEQPHQQVPQETGFIAGLRAATPDIMKDNAPRIVGGMKMVGASWMIFSGNKLFRPAGIGFVSANCINALFGGKKSEADKEKLRSDKDKTDGAKNPITDFTSKMLQPHKYPIESTAGVSTLASVAWAGSGVFGGGGFYLDA